MRDGLIELIDKSGMVEGRTRCEIIADELIANGVILPPCKVGDIVYTVGVNTGQSIEAKVLAIGIDEYGLYLLLTSGLSVSVEQQLDKTVFLTKEDAEKALKDKDNGN